MKKPFLIYIKKRSARCEKSRLLFLKENTPSFNEEKELPTEEDLSKKEAELREDLEDLAEQNKKVLKESANTQLSIEHLEKMGRIRRSCRF